MTAVLMGLASAVAFGTADFLAGVLSRRAHFAVIGLISQVGAAAGACAALPWFDGTGPSAASGWGAASGLGGGVGSLALYRGLGPRADERRGATVSGRRCRPARPGRHRPQGTPLVAGRRRDRARAPRTLAHRPTRRHCQGVRCGRGGRRTAGRCGLRRAVQLAALFVLADFVALRRPARTTASTGGRTVGVAVLVGVLSVTATLLYFLATHAGLLTVVAVPAPLYPAITVVLAAFVLRERASLLQRVGLAAATAAVALVTIG